MVVVTSEMDSAASVDVALVRRARTGDGAAFDTLVGPRIDRCFRLAWSILANEADAADATQEALVSAWRELPRLRNEAAFDGWLNRIVASKAFSMARRHRIRLREISVRSPNEDDGAQDLGPPQARTSRTGQDDIVDNDAIARAFDRLRPQDRVIPSFITSTGGRSPRSRRSLGIPVGTAKWRLHAARRALELAMEAEGMNGQRLTDAQIAAALRAHVPERAPAALLNGVLNAVDTTRQQRPAPPLLSRLMDADPTARRRSLLIAAALLVGLAIASAAGVGAKRLQQHDPIPGVGSRTAGCHLEPEPRSRGLARPCAP